MAGITNPVRALPFGYNSKDNFAAVEKKPDAPPPSSYNRDALPQAPWLRKNRTVTPVGGIPWPSANRQDAWNNINARAMLAPILSNYNTNPVPYPPGSKLSPETISWSREHALSVLAGSEGVGNIQPPKGDMLSVAKVFAETTSDPAEKDLWERYVNSLAQLDAISQSRSLTPEESKKKDEILRAISVKSQGPLAIDAPARAAKPAPATAADIAALMARMQGPQQPPPSIPATQVPVSTPIKVNPKTGKPVPGPPPGTPQQALAQALAQSPMKPPLSPSIINPPSQLAQQMTAQQKAPFVSTRDTIIDPVDQKSTDPAVVMVNEAKLSQSFSDLIKSRYRNGFDTQTAAVWRAALNKIGLDDRKLQPAQVIKNPLNARDMVISLNLLNKGKTAAAMQSLVEFGEAYLDSAVANKQLELLYSNSSIGKFTGFPHLALKLV